MPDSSLQPARIIIKPGADYADQRRRWQGIPGIERAPGGRLWATWYTGGAGEGPGNYVVLVTSADGGVTWSGPQIAVHHVEPECRCYDPCLWCDPLGRLWLFWAQSEKWNDGRAGVWAITSGNPDAAQPDWSAPRRLCNGVMMNKPLVLSTGEWCLPAAVWGTVQPNRDELAAERFSSLIVSVDQGATWTRRGGADVPNRAFDEHMVVERRDGSLWMLVRRHDGVGEAVSTDCGATWTATPEPVLQGPNARFFLRRLRSGRLLLVNHARRDARSHLTAWLSEDDGQSWIGGMLLDERVGVAYPDGVEAPDGLLRVIYDYNRGDCYARGRDREILLAQFREADVLQAHLVSSDARLRLRVNQASGVYPGAWHGDERYFGLHYDLHAGATDTELGTRCSEAELVPMLRLMAPDFVQTDCKGHPGYTSWFSRVPNASVPEGLRQDAMLQWRQATRALGLPLHCHYSGVWDKAAGAKHPDWCTVTADGTAAGAPFGQNAGAPTHEKMCLRSPYLDELMIPQMLELIDRYEVDGFWVDGDLWAVEPCYCGACKAAWTAQTGLAEPPVKEDDPAWSHWWNFTRESFYAMVTRYCDAVHRHKPGVLVCSNWLQTFKNPGAPEVPTDWISGDNSWVWGLDGSRCEARFLSTRGKPWDIMLWNFYCSHGMGKPESPWTVKPPQMLMQEAAVLLAFGGNVQIYEHPPVRDGRLVPWRQQRLAEVSAFVKARRPVCQHTTTIPQIAVLHSEHHLFSDVRGKNLMWNVDVAPVQGALFALLENSYGVDVLDEWALLPCLAEFPLVVVPEQSRLSDPMVAALKGYVEAGGSLLLTGSELFERFGEEFLGFRSLEVQEQKTYAVPAADGDVPLYSRAWRLGEVTSGEVLARLGRGCLLEDRLLPNPAAVVNRVGQGQVAYVPADLFRDFACNRYPLTRCFVGALAQRLLPEPAIRVTAPTCIDVALRRRDQTLLVHLVNRGSGLPNLPNNGAIDEIPPVGPVSVRIALARRPLGVSLALETGKLGWKWTAGQLEIRLSAVHLHAVVIVEPAPARPRVVAGGGLRFHRNRARWPSLAKKTMQRGQL